LQQKDLLKKRTKKKKSIVAVRQDSEDPAEVRSSSAPIEDVRGKLEDIGPTYRKRNKGSSKIEDE